MSFAGGPLPRTDGDVPMQARGGTTTTPSEPRCISSVAPPGPDSAPGLLDVNDGQLTAKSQQDFLPSFAPISPLSSSPYFSQGFASFPSMSEDLTATSPRSTATAPSPFRAQPPPRLNLPPLHLDSFKQLSPEELASPTQLSYRRSPSPASPQISPGVASPTKAGRAVVLDARDRNGNGELERLSPALTPRPNGSLASPVSSSSSSHQRPSTGSSPAAAERRMSSPQPPLPLSATSDQFPLDPASRASSSSHSAEQRQLGRKGTVGLSLVKASNEARASSPGGQKEVMRGLGFVEAVEASAEIDAQASTVDPPGTATSTTFGPPQAVRRASSSGHPVSPPPAPSPSGPPPPVPTLPQKSTPRLSRSASPAAAGAQGTLQQPVGSSGDGRPLTGNSTKSSVSSQSSGPSSRKAGPSSAGAGGLSMPPLPVPPTFANLPRSDSGVLDPRLLNGSLVESSPPQEILLELPRSDAQGPAAGIQDDGPVNFAGIGSRHLFSPLANDGVDVAPAANRSSAYDSSPALAPTPSQRRALPHPPKQTSLPNHPPPPQPQSRGSYPPQAQIASPASISKRLVDPASRYSAAQGSGVVADDPYQAARRSLDPQTFQGMVGQVGQTTMGPEVCLECMMRDRDLMHVDVSSPGIWARQSDVDLLDLATRESHGEDITPHLAGGLSWEGGGPIGMGKVPGMKVKTQRTIAGDRLTEGALKEWTLKSPPAATHRFQTLQKYLIGQLQLIVELGGPATQSQLAGVSSEVETRILRSKIQNTFAPLRRDEHVTLTPADAARMRPAKGRPGPDRDSTVDVENYDGKMSMDRDRSRRKSVGLEVHNKQGRYSKGDRSAGAFPPSSGEALGQGQTGHTAHQQGLRSTTMPMPTSASATNFPSSRQMAPQDDNGYRMSTAASFSNVPLPRGEAMPTPEGKAVRPFSFAMWAGRTRSSSNASQDAPRGGIFKGRFGAASGRSEASDMTGGGAAGSAWGGSGSMMNMHIALDRDQERQKRLSYASPYQQNASTDALNQRWRTDGDNMSYADSSQFFPHHYPGSAPTSPGRVPTEAPQQGKKKKGLRAFFSKLGGGSVKSSSSFGNSPQLANGQFTGGTPSQGYPSPVPGSEDFGPLAPPPSLKFLSRGKTPSTSSLQSLSSGPNSPRGPPPPGTDRSRAGSLSGSSVFSSPAMVAPALSSGQSFSSSQHPRSVSTPIHVGPGPNHGKAPSVSHSVAPSANSMSPASGSFPARRSSRDTVGSRKSIFVGGDGPRVSPADSLPEAGFVSANGEYFAGGDLHQRRAIAPLQQGSSARFSSTQPTTHRLSVSSGPPPSAAYQQAAASFGVGPRRQSGSFQKDLPPLPPPSPNSAAEPVPLPSFVPHSPIQGPNSWHREPSSPAAGFDPAQTVRGSGTEKSKKEKKPRGKLSGFFGVGAAKKESFDSPRSSSRNGSRHDDSLIGYRYSSHEKR